MILMRVQTFRNLRLIAGSTWKRNLISERLKMSEQTIPPSLKAIAAEVAGLLQERKETISVAETAAGGLISAAILATPGASRIYKGGLTVSIKNSFAQNDTVIDWDTDKDLSFIHCNHASSLLAGHKPTSTITKGLLQILLQASLKMSE